MTSICRTRRSLIKRRSKQQHQQQQPCFRNPWIVFVVTFVALGSLRFRTRTRRPIDAGNPQAATSWQQPLTHMGLRKPSPQRSLAYELLKGNRLGSSSKTDSFQRYQVVWIERSKGRSSFSSKPQSQQQTSIKTTPVSVQEWTQLMLSKDEALLTEFIQVLQKGNDFAAFFWETPGVIPHTVSTQKMEFVLQSAPQLHQFAGSKRNQNQNHPRPAREQGDRSILGDNHASISSPFDSAFQQAHCSRTVSSACVFPNLGGDATLIAPMQPVAVDNNLPRTLPFSYGHLAEFVRTAPMSHVREFLQMVFRAYQQSWTLPDDKTTSTKKNATTPVATTKSFNTPSTTRRQHQEEAPVWMSTNGMGVPWLHVRLDTHPKYYTYAPYTKISTEAKADKP